MGGYAQISMPEKGTTWIYDYSNVSACGPIHSVYDRDTFLAGKKAIVQKQTLYNICTHPYDNKAIDTLSWLSNIFAIEDSVVWYWNENRFDTLINFGARVGDKWNYTFHEDDTLKTTVVSRGKSQDLGTYLVLEYMYTYQLEDTATYLQDTVYERTLGGHNYIVPWDRINSRLDGQVGGPLVCFSNSSGRYSNGVWTPGGAACTDIIEKLNIENVEKTNSFQVYPNPSSGKIYFKSKTNEQPNRISVLDIRGAVVFESKQTNETIALSPQLYFIEIESQDGIVEVHKVLVR